jgi:hypothetical protein
MKLARRWGRDEPRQFVRQILAVLREGLPKRLPASERANPMYARVAAALRAVDVNAFSGRAQLCDAIDELRAACGAVLGRCDSG